MFRLIPLFPLLLLAACVSPAPDFFGAERQEVTRGGIRFVIYRSGAEVEVVRMGYLARPARAAVPRLMAEAVEEATGCPVVPGSMTTKIPGETGVARFDLNCPG